MGREFCSCSADPKAPSPSAGPRRERGSPRGSPGMGSVPWRLTGPANAIGGRVSWHGEGEVRAKGNTPEAATPLQGATQKPPRASAAGEGEPSPKARFSLPGSAPRPWDRAEVLGDRHRSPRGPAPKPRGPAPRPRGPAVSRREAKVKRSRVGDRVAYLRLRALPRGAGDQTSFSDPIKRGQRPSPGR